MEGRADGGRRAPPHDMGGDRRADMRADMGFAEFVGLMALTVSIVALSIDIMLAALPRIGAAMGVTDENDRQLVITVFVLGLALSPVPFGLAGDAFGRKPVIFFGLGLFSLGALLAAAATDFDTLLAARFLQGLGAAAPRTLSVAIVRDRAEGREMARIMSYVMLAFILVLACAPALGQLIKHVADWRATFLSLLAIAAAIVLWMGLRMPESLPQARRRPVRLRPALEGAAAMLGDRRSLGFTLAAGFVFGAFLAYLGSAQQLLAEAYGLGEGFTVAFSVLALFIGGSSYLNARLVRGLGMRKLAWRALLVSVAMAALFLVAGLAIRPPLWMFALWAAVSFSCFGLSIGNLNALAMAPLGAAAGIGAALVGTISNLLSVPLAMLIAEFYDGSAAPIALGFLVCNAAALLAIAWADAGSRQEAGGA